MIPVDELVPGLVGLTLCAAPAVWAGRQLLLAAAARGWPTAPGIVNSSRCVERRQRRGWEARVLIDYRFACGDRTFTGTRVAFGTALNFNTAAARALVARYPTGAAVTVRHHPEHPSICCLEPRADWRLWGIVGLTSVLFLLIAQALVSAT